MYVSCVWGGRAGEGGTICGDGVKPELLVIIASKGLCECAGEEGGSTGAGHHRVKGAV